MNKPTAADVKFSKDQYSDTLGVVVTLNGEVIGRVRKGESGHARGWWTSKPAGRGLRASGYIFRTRRVAVEDLLAYVGR